VKKCKGSRFDDLDLFESFKEGKFWYYSKQKVYDYKKWGDKGEDLPNMVKRDRLPRLIGCPLKSSINFQQ